MIIDSQQKHYVGAFLSNLMVTWPGENCFEEEEAKHQKENGTHKEGEMKDHSMRVLLSLLNLIISFCFLICA